MSAEHASTALFLEVDPRSPSGLMALRQAPAWVPGEVAAWPGLLDETVASAERADLDTAAVHAVERRLHDDEMLSIRHHLGTPAPTYYERADQIVMLQLLTQVLRAGSGTGLDGDARHAAEAAAHLFRYASEHGLRVRVGMPEQLASEQRERLVLQNRVGDPVDAAVLRLWPRADAPELPAAQYWIDELFASAERLGVDAAAAAETEAEVRRQPAPGRLRLDEDIAELLALVESVLSAADDGLRASPAGQEFTRLAALLTFAHREHLLVSTRPALTRTDNRD
jgi:hypothetical protein